jgi:hypothetical protein
MMEAVVKDSELVRLADAAFEQYFLVSERKLSLLMSAAGIRPDDRVIEVGAGAGTVARRIPACKSLTLVELDERLIAILRMNVPSADAIQGDALTLIQEIPFDVLIGSLPNVITESLIDILPALAFRTAVLAVGEAADLDRLKPTFEVTEVTTISGDDFVPPQPSVSRLVRVARPVAA